MTAQNTGVKCRPKRVTPNIPEKTAVGKAEEALDRRHEPLHALSDQLVVGRQIAGQPVDTGGRQRDPGECSMFASIFILAQPNAACVT
jgi:hypothetical protein